MPTVSEKKVKLLVNSMAKPVQNQLSLAKCSPLPVCNENRNTKEKQWHNRRPVSKIIPLTISEKNKPLNKKNAEIYRQRPITMLSSSAGLYSALPSCTDQPWLFRAAEF
jgi:hypothetical protein